MQLRSLTPGVQSGWKLERRRLQISRWLSVNVPRLPECCSWTIFFHHQAQVKTSPDSMSPDLSHTPSFRTQAENPVRPPTYQTSTNRQNNPPPRPDTLPDQNSILTKARLNRSLKVPAIPNIITAQKIKSVK
ncbi:hypothetical protein CHARACLAT_010629 [Characodon lateralis]|uniref:Uncharacterized protein n=1 Tax=Characodon lateralis TaxID=208331 RepID=A0ABU7F1X2_9TELE|nr:hypothetical protein [Characodon lateralis]